MSFIFKAHSGFFVAYIALLSFSLPAHAYLDGGTINMVLQLIGAAIVGGLVSIKVFWHKIVMFFRKYSGKNDS